MIEIKIMAKELLIKKIDDTNIGFVLEFKDGAKMNVEKVLKYAKLNPNLLELKPKSKIILKSSSDRKKKIFELKSFLKHIKENFIQQ